MKPLWPRKKCTLYTTAPPSEVHETLSRDTAQAFFRLTSQGRPYEGKVSDSTFSLESVKLGWEEKAIYLHGSFESDDRQTRIEVEAGCSIIEFIVIQLIFIFFMTLEFSGVERHWGFAFVYISLFLAFLVHWYYNSRRAIESAIEEFKQVLDLEDD